MPPRERTTRFVLLGAIQQLGAASGYEIQRFIAESIGHFWNESFGQIYPELADMKDRGWLTIAPEREPEGRGRVRYKATAEGRRALQAWLARPAVSQPVRQELLLKVFMGSLSGADTVRAHLDRERADAVAHQAHLAAIASTLLSDYATDPDLGFSLMTVRAGQRRAHARVQWVDDCERLLRAGARGPRAIAEEWKRLQEIP